MKDRILPQGALIEMIQQGSYVRVAAGDPRTNIEVSIVGDPKAGQKKLEEIAVQKLRRASL